MKDGTWVRVVTYDWVMGIPSWAERTASVSADRDGYHEICVPPNSILYLAPEVAEDLLLKPRAVHLPGERKLYVPVLEREKKTETEIPKDVPRRSRRSRVDCDDLVRIIKLA